MELAPNLSSPKKNKTKTKDHPPTQPKSIQVNASNPSHPSVAMLFERNQQPSIQPHQKPKVEKQKCTP